MDAEPRTSTEPVVALDEAVAVIGRFPALAGATLRVAAGEILLLQGPNGAGKTSLLRLCAGLLPLARGCRPGARARPRHSARGDPAPGGAARPPQRSLPRPDRRRERRVLGRHGRRHGRRGGGGDRTARRRRTVAERPGLQAVRRTVPPHGAGAASSPAGPSCGCSTSRTPGSTPPAATSSTPCSVRQSAPGRR